MVTVQPPGGADRDRGRLSGPALRAFLRIADLWGLPVDQQMILLGVTARSTFLKWKKSGSALPKDTLERISYILGIYEALQVLLPDSEAADAWVRRPECGVPVRRRLTIGVSRIDRRP